MSSPPPEQQQLVGLLDDGEYELSQRALDEGKRDLRDYFGRDPTDSEIVQYIIDTLQTHGVCLTCAPQGNPPGSRGVAWQVTDTRQIFIKLRLQERRMGEYYAYVQSCHRSVHA
jgi:hypothetical protein